jgi:hypothetical protein
MKKHGERRTRLYNIWSGMIRRCENPNEPAHIYYGGRGISVCKEWRESFVAFRDWARANGYEPHLTIDRRNNSGNYEPDNCHWTTYAQQKRNSRRNRHVLFRGRTMLVCDLALEVGLEQRVLGTRLFRYGWDIERAVSEPVAERRRDQ